jgi:hypothetical protein
MRYVLRSWESWEHFAEDAAGIGTDLLIYSLVIPVVPFQLEKLGYSGVSNLTGWLLFAFVSRVRC